jgi:hypothetical protein
MSEQKLLKVGDFDMTKARRKLKKKLAAVIINAMAETDADYDYIAARLRMDSAKVEKEICGLITGQTKALDEVSDLMLAMGAECVISLQSYQEPVRPAPLEQVKEDEC